MALTIAELVVEVGADIDGALGGLRSVSDRMTSTGTAVARQGVMLGAAIAPMALAFGGAVKSAGAFEEAMVNAQAVLGASAGEMAVLNDEILRIGAGARAGPQAAAEAFYDIVSGVADATTHMAILEAAIRTAEAGSADLGATTNSLVSIMNAYGFSAEEAARVSDVMTRTVGAGVLTMEELAGAIPQVTGMGKQMGVEFEELGMAMAFLTTKGFSASESATQIQAAMVALIKPTGEMEQAFRELGVSGGEELIAKFGGLQGALTAVTGTTAYAEEGMGSLFGRVEAMKAVLTLTGDGAEEFAATFTESIEGATEAAQAIQLESLNAQIDLLKSQAQALGIEVGRVLVPALTRMAMRVRPLVAALTGWIRENPKLVTGVAAVVAAIAGVAAIMTGAGAAIAAVGAILGALPFLAVAAAAAALYLAFKTNFLGLGDLMRGAFEDIKGVVTSIIDWFRGTADAVKSAFEAGGLKAAGAALLAGLLAGIGNVAAWVYEEIISPIISYLKTVNWAEVPSKIGDLLSKLLDWVVTAGAWVDENILFPIIDYLKTVDWAGVGNTLLDLMGKFLGWAWAAYKTAATWVFANIVRPVIDYLGTVNWGDVGNTLMTLVEGFLGWAGAAFKTAATWVFAKIVTPIVAYLGTVSWSDVGNTLMTLIGRFLGWAWAAYKTAATWIFATIVKPIVDYLAGINWADVPNQLLALLEKFLGVVGSGILSVGQWIWDTIIQPIIDMFNGSVEAVFAAAAGIGEAIFGAIVGALTSLPAAIAKLIDDAIPNSIDLGIVKVDLPDNPVGDMLGMRAAGGPVARGGSYIVGESGPELFVPGSSGTIVPNYALGEAGGRTVNITGPVHIHGVQNPKQLLDALEREAGRRNMRLATARA